MTMHPDKSALQARRRPHRRSLLLLVGVGVAIMTACDNKSTPVEPPPDTDPNPPFVASSPPWAWQNPYPSGNNGVAVQSFGGGRALVLTEYDGFLTEDGGASWTPLYFGDQYFRGTYRYDGLLTVLSGKILLSEDQGRTWRQVAAPPSIFPLAAAFVDHQNGVVTGGSGRIFTTDDGGTTWTARFSGSAYHLNDVAYLDPSTIFAVGGDHAVRSIDGGVTWEPLTNTGLFVTAFAIDIIDGIIRIVDYGGGVSISTDQGDTWSRQDPEAPQLNAVEFIDAVTGIAAGNNGSVRTTVNGGTSWTTWDLGSTENLNGASVSADDRWVVGDNGAIFRLTNFPWEDVRKGHPIDLVDVSFYDEFVGMAVGPGCGLLLTTNGGESWGKGKFPSPLSLNCTAGDLNAIAVYGPKQACAVGMAGEIWTTINLGIPWTRRDGVTSADLYDVAFADSANGMIVGSQSVVFVTTDAGVTWTPRSNFSGNTNRAVAMSAPGIAFVVGDGGTVRRTETGGMSWQLVDTTLPDLDFLDVAMLNDTTAVVIGENGSFEPNIFKTTDAGQSWIEIVIPRDPKRLAFGSGSNGYLVADRAIYTTDDGGITWNGVNAPTRVSLNAVCAVSDNIATIVGSQGAILRTTTGGTQSGRTGQAVNRDWR